VTLTSTAYLWIRAVQLGAIMYEGRDSHLPYGH
jgi:hypothetical protein